MFFSKKRNKPCVSHNGVLECESVENLRKYQKELDEIKNLDIEKVLQKYHLIGNIDNYDHYSRYYNGAVLRCFQYFILPNINAEQMLKGFVDDVLSIKNNKERITELYKKIDKEKEKLGIK